MISIEDFCERHHACLDDRDWAVANCKTMADVWATARPEWLVWVATRPGVLDDRTLRLFSVGCARSAAWDARDAARAAWSAARDEAWDCARSAARDAARAAWSAARAAAWDAARERQAIWLRQHCKPNFSMVGE